MIPLKTVTMNGPQGRRNQPGFTIIELAVVIILIGISIAIVAPRFGPIMQGTRANQAANVIQSDMQRIFSEAIKNKRVVRITFNNTNMTYTVTDRTSNEEIFKQYFSGTQSEYALTSFEATPTTVDVFPRGVSSAALTINIGVVNENRRVTMTRVGHTRVIGL